MSKEDVAIQLFEHFAYDRRANPGRSPRWVSFPGEDHFYDVPWPKAAPALGMLVQLGFLEYSAKGDAYAVTDQRGYEGMEDISVLKDALRARMASTSPAAVAARTCAYVTDPDLRKIVERDYAEIDRASQADCWKATIVLAGGAIEAILADLLASRAAQAKAAKAAPREPDISKWTFRNLIDVAVELSLVSDGVSKLSHPVREYRNLVHPANEKRTALRFGREEANIAVEVLNILHRDLGP
jgi:hypothetical protein